ncbi:DUF397 domain-containing protein [Streptomyces sp. OfavH-34-F]|uniref:DUF397 domain-containing protein n=1 Tax=unclassified Streptomyces TaxID=2593676 RepID=UPI001EF36A48|nr:DUF397 domain-containing protein [Streptomyces sp. OfavH-34-F]MCG7527247.1 DUF397 domain-containing protein [Streptomyces sp. OfavH-34-F]
MAIRQGATTTWTKSSYSGPNGACVEVRSPLARAVDVRDSKAPEGPSVTFVPGAWSAFVREVAKGVADA